MTEKNTNKTANKAENVQVKKKIGKRRLKKLNSQTILCLIAIVVAVLAILEAAYVHSQMNVFKAQQSQLSEKAINKLETQIESLSALQTQIPKLSDKLKQNASAVNNISNQLQEFKATKPTIDNYWTLLEIKYLLTIANYHLQLLNQPKVAIAILQTADKLAEELNHPDALKLRASITNAITELQAVAKIDTAGLLMKINAIENELAKLPLAKPDIQKQATNMSTKKTSNDWHSYWDKSLQTLQKLVVIRHSDKAVEPLTSPKQQMYLVTNVQSKLAQMSWALLHNNQTVFHNSLESALQWIENYFDDTSPQTTSIIKALKAMQTVELQPAIPNLQHSLDMTQQLIEENTK